MSQFVNEEVSQFIKTKFKTTNPYFYSHILLFSYTFILSFRAFHAFSVASAINIGPLDDNMNLI